MGRLTEEPVEFPAGGLEGALLVLGITGMKQWPPILNRIDEQPFHRDLSQRRGVVEVPDEISAQEPQVIDMLTNGLLGQARHRQVFEEWPETAHQPFSRRQIFFPPNP